VEEGSRVITGGGVPDMPGDLKGGTWIQPTIWTGLSVAAATVTEEIFGPRCHISPFDGEDEVIVRANATGYGLAASVWTTNLARAHRVAARVETGLVWVNSWFLRDLRTPPSGA
jgi:aminomuconate-semialdehyde/2-hydroxymuconate-6-semialdehyde dehydrogenase